MTDRVIDTEWVDARTARADRLAETGMYLPETESDACGVGFVAAIDGTPRRSVVENGITAPPRGARKEAHDRSGTAGRRRAEARRRRKTETEGDACGVGFVAARASEKGMCAQRPRRGGRRRQDRRGVQIPEASFRTRSGAPATSRASAALAVGQVFLPRTDFGAQETCRTIVEAEVLRLGHAIYGWRQVPVNIAVPRPEGQRDPPRDRADPDRQCPRRRRGDLRARALRHPPPGREGGGEARRCRASTSARSPAGA